MQNCRLARICGSCLVLVTSMALLDGKGAWAFGQVPSASGAADHHPLRVSLVVDVSAPARAVWERIADFNAWSLFLSSVESSRMSGHGPGAVRFVKLKGFTDLLVERLEDSDIRGQTLTYRVIDSPLPVSDFVGKLEVHSTSVATARVRWSAHFLPKSASRDDSEQLIRQQITQGLSELAGIFVPKVTLQKQIAAPAQDVWSVVGDFNDMPRFLPVLGDSRLVCSDRATFRLVRFIDGVTDSIERLDGLDDQRMIVSYSALGTPFQLANYGGTMQVQPSGTGSLVTWSVSYVPLEDPDAALALMQGAVGLGLDTLASLFAPQ